MNFPDCEEIRPGDSWVRQAVDPNGTLPKVVLARDYSFEPRATISAYGHPSYQFNMFVLGDGCVEQIGEAAVSERTETGECYFSWIYVGTDYQTRGMGLAAYVLAIEAAHAAGRVFATDEAVSAQARRVWDRLIGIGVARVVLPFTEHAVDENGEVSYSGSVRSAPLVLHQ